MSTSFRYLALLGCSLLTSVAACESAPPPSGCDADEDCPAGQYCGPGGCLIDCVVSSDCAPGLTCTPRGRCATTMSDSGMPDAPGRRIPCVDDSDCSDGLFCNGYEFCLPDNEAADPSTGCTPSIGACRTEDCDETRQLCDPCLSPDEDGDTIADVACGGRDCDDQNRAISPAAIELCDPEGLDEDCNLETLGAVSEDSDRDGHYPSTCCNRRPGFERCGDDCSDVPSMDADAARRYGSGIESCDYVDNDCDGRVDEGQQVLFYRDADGDNQGIAIPTPTREPDGTLPVSVAPYARLDCIGRAPVGWSLVNTDCNDMSNLTFRGAAEDCSTAADDNCNGTNRDGCPCLSTDTRPCGGFGLDGRRVGNVGQCRQAADATCDTAARRFVECSPMARDASAESCDGLDNDCDGAPDNGFECVLGAGSGCRACSDRAVGLARSCESRDGRCGWGACRAPASTRVWDETNIYSGAGLTSYSARTRPSSVWCATGVDDLAVERPPGAGPLRVGTLLNSEPSCIAVQGPGMRLPAGSYRAVIEFAGTAGLNVFSDIRLSVTVDFTSASNTTGVWAAGSSGVLFSDSFTVGECQSVSLSLEVVRNSIGWEVYNSGFPLVPLGGFAITRMYLVAM